MKDKNLNIKYTDTALEQLEKFKKEQVTNLEEYLVKDKYVLGDDLVEITASDIKEALDNMKVSYSRKRESSSFLFKSEAIKTASIVYTTLGMIITIGAFYYEKFIDLLIEKPTTAKLALVGIIMTMLGLLMNFTIRRKEREMKKKKDELTKINIENNYFEK